MGASAAAAIIIKREKELAEHFRRAGATRPEAAQSPDSLGVDQNFIWRRLAHREVIREAGDGAYYFDEAAWDDLGRMRRRVAVIVVSAAVLLGLVLYFFGTSVARASGR